MTATPPPTVECEQQHAGLRVTDVLAAVEFYTTKLGFRPGFTWGDPPTFAGVNLGSVQMFLQQGTPGPAGCEVYFRVGNADELYEFQRANGVEIVEPPGDREYGLRDYSVRDLHGYELSFGHYIYNTGPPIRIERVDVPVRLEKRLAGLLRDLAEHKRMSLVELSGGNTPAHARWCGTAHRSGSPSHRNAEAQTRHRLRQPWELSVQGGDMMDWCIKIYDFCRGDKT